jgi:hypothetical protein
MMNTLHPADDLATSPLPLPESFEYDEQTRVLKVGYTDGMRIRYYDVPATAHFLLPLHLNSHKVADFLQARSQYRSERIS